MQTPKIKLIKMYVVIASTLSAFNMAHGDVISSNSSTDDSVYAALKWTFGESIKPEALLGLRHAKTYSNGDTDGGDLSISAKFFDGFQFGKLRGKYFNGNENVQAEIGGGYDFNKGLFAGIGVHAPYSDLGADLLPLSKDSLESYIQIDTIGRYRKPSYRITSSCIPDASHDCP
jgi:hypothetical protein